MFFETSLSHVCGTSSFLIHLLLYSCGFDVIGWLLPLFDFDWCCVHYRMPEGSCWFRFFDYSLSFMCWCSISWSRRIYLWVASVWLIRHGFINSLQDNDPLLITCLLHFLVLFRSSSSFYHLDVLCQVWSIFCSSFIYSYFRIFS